MLCPGSFHSGPLPPVELVPERLERRLPAPRQDRVVETRGHMRVQVEPQKSPALVPNVISVTSFKGKRGDTINLGSKCELPPGGNQRKVNVYELDEFFTASALRDGIFGGCSLLSYPPRGTEELWLHTLIALQLVHSMVCAYP